MVCDIPVGVQRHDTVVCQLQQRPGHSSQNLHHADSLEKKNLGPPGAAIECKHDVAQLDVCMAKVVLVKVVDTIHQLTEEILCSFFREVPACVSAKANSPHHPFAELGGAPTREGKARQKERHHCRADG